MAGKLYLCATPIGNLDDITYRVLETLKSVDLIAAEDTRNSIKLLNHFDIHVPMTSYHEFNKIDKAKYLVNRMLEGVNIALITDAGTPGISDPGEELVRFCYEAGIEVTSLPVNAEGAVSPESLALALRPDTVLVSVMTANNEVGTVQPIKELTALAHEHNVPFHTDAVQAYAHIPLNVKNLGVDALSVSAHKFHGPKGVGFLYCKRGLKTEPLISGGAQERGYRAGTENLAGIIGMTAAAQLAFGAKELEPTEAESLFAMEAASAHVRTLRNKMQQFICANIPNVQVNSCRNRCLPGILSVSFKGVSGEALLALLDQQGVCASAGSACASGSLEPSHVLTAMGVQPEWLRGTVRFSFSALTTEAEVEKACEILREAVQHLRAVSAQ